MPTIDTYLSDLEQLLETDLPRDQDRLEEILSYIKGEITRFEDDELSIEIKDSNRPDLWSVEGIARSLNIASGLKKFKQYKVEDDSKVKVIVSPEVKEIRSFIACSVIRSVHINDMTIKGFMHLQDKLDLTYGRDRKRTSIGLYDFDLIEPPIYYKGSQPNETSFVPLEFDQVLTLDQILDKHPKGIQYGHIVKPFKIWPVLVDAKGDVLSFPPIINSNNLGKITEKTRNILIEVTGTSMKLVDDVLTIVAIALADRKGSIESVEVSYPYLNLGTRKTPVLKSEEWTLQEKYVKEITGLNLNSKEIMNLLKKAGFDAHLLQEKITVDVPCYRKDIIHPIDLVEEVVIAFGLNNIKPRWPLHQTFGGLTHETIFMNRVADLVTGFGFQEVLTYTLSNIETLFDKMTLNHQPVLEIENPKMSSYTCLRNWLTPSLIDFLSQNTHIDYPQKIFEIGNCVKPNHNSNDGVYEWKALSAVIAHPKTGYTEMKEIMDSLLLNLDVKSTITRDNQPYFIDGRNAKIIINGKKIGRIGEIHPEILEKWRIEVPIASFEFNLSSIYEILYHPK